MSNGIPAVSSFLVSYSILSFLVYLISLLFLPPPPFLPSLLLPLLLTPPSSPPPPPLPLLLPLGIQMETLLELFGQQFFRNMKDSGHYKVVRCLGHTLEGFLHNLDTLHDHIAIAYPEMRAPSFRCVCGVGPSSGGCGYAVRLR